MPIPSLRLHVRLIGVVLTSIALALFAGAPLRAGGLAEDEKTPEFDLKEHYTKYEYRIPMRDGAKLFTAVFVPKDASTTYPFLMVRTPYSIAPYGPDELGRGTTHGVGPAEIFTKAGYIIVNQDVRGRM